MVVGQHQHPGAGAAARRAPARGAPARGARAPRATASASGASSASDRCSGRESTRCRSRSWRARIRASSRPTWPTPKIATDGTTGSGSSSTRHLAAAALHAVLERRLVGQVRGERLRRDRAGCRAARARGVRPPPRGCRRRSRPRSTSAETTILAPASRGAWPRTSVTVTSTPASRAARSAATACEPGRHRRLRRQRDRGRGRAPSRPPRAWPARPARRGRPAGPNAAHASRSASRTLNASISGGSPTALEP